MAPALDVDAVAPEGGPAVVVLGGDGGQRRQRVEFGHGLGDGLNPLGLGGHVTAHLAEQVVFQVVRALFGAENLVLAALQVGRVEPLGVLQRLAALVLLGDAVEVGVRDLDVVAVDGVEPHLQRVDAGALALLCLQALDPRLPLAFGLAEVIEFRVVAPLDDVALGDFGRGVLADGRVDFPSHALQRVERVVEPPEFPTVGVGQQGTEVGHHVQGLLERAQVAGVGPAPRDAGDEPLDVVHLAQALVQALARADRALQFRDGVQATLDALAVDERAAQPVSEFPPAQRAGRLVEDAHEGAALAAADGSALEQFEALDGHRVKHHVLAGVVAREVVQVVEVAVLPTPGVLGVGQ